MSGITTTFTSTHDINLHGCGESIAAASDNNPAENVKPFAFCKHVCGTCIPLPLAISKGGSTAGPWFETAESFVDAGESVLTEESYFLCVTGANAKVEFVDPGQDCIKVGDQKSIRALLAELSALNQELPFGPLLPDMMDERARKQAIEKEILSRVPYNAVQFVSSHNSYDTDDHSIGISGQFNNHQVHSFELDIHKGDPDLIVDEDDYLEEEFFVYHDFRDPDTRIKTFSQGMNEIDSLGNSLPVTVFVDLKDELNESGDHTSATFDKILEDSIGNDKLYTPQDLIEKAQSQYPNVTTLAEAVEKVGMPTLEELNGRVIVVATDSIGSYTGDKAFVAGKPHIEDGVITDENMVFFNIGRPKNGPDIFQGVFGQDPYGEKEEKMLAAIEKQGYVSRGYYFNGEDFSDGKDHGLNHITTNEVGNEWNDISEYGFPFKIKENFLQEDFEETQEQEGKLAVISGATLTCPKAVHPADIKFFRMKKLFS